VSSNFLARATAIFYLLAGLLFIWISILALRLKKEDIDKAYQTEIIEQKFTKFGIIIALTNPYFNNLLDFFSWLIPYAVQPKVSLLYQYFSNGSWWTSIFFNCGFFHSPQQEKDIIKVCSADSQRYLAWSYLFMDCLFWCNSIKMLVFWL